MQTQVQKERLINNIIWNCFESVSVLDFSRKTLPLFNQLLHASRSLVAQGSEEYIPVPMAGSLKEVLPNYCRECMADDPIQEALHRYPSKLQRAALLPEWEDYQKTTVYNEFAIPNGVHDFFHIKLGRGPYTGPGSVVLMFARSSKQTDFEEQDGLNLATFLPVLESMVQRDAILQTSHQALPILEAMVEMQSPLALAFSLKGRLLWMSQKAEEMLKPAGKGRINLPEELISAVLRFGELNNAKQLVIPPPTQITFVSKSAEATRAQLRLISHHSGESFVMVEFDPPLFNPQLERIRTRYGLTISETKVLGLIAQGMANLNIASYLSISPDTVRTHVSRILGKLGVNSRVQAALLAHDHPITIEQD